MKAVVMDCKSASTWRLPLREAILKIMRDEAGEMRAPYHWAGFFLQGFWNKFLTLTGLD
jgi:hypothetical protein